MSRLVLALFGLFICGSVTASSCDPATLDGAKNTGLVAFLKSCERAPTSKDTVLFTWGHIAKLNQLRRLGYNDFAVFNNAQQFAFANAKAVAKFPTVEQPLLAKPAFHKFIDRVAGSIGVMNVGELLNYSLNNENLRQLQNLYSGASARGGQIKSRQQEQRYGEYAAATAVLRVLAYEQISPGFIADLPISTAEHLKVVNESLEADGLTAPERRRLEGRKLGLQRALTPVTEGDKKPSNVSYGPAVYFANRPDSFVSHYYNKDYAGLACTLEAKKDRISDLQQALDVMQEKGVLLPKVNGFSKRYPSDYNELANPVQFRVAMMGRLLHKLGLYIDSGVIRYNQPGQCRDIRLSDFTDCHAALTLMNQLNFTHSRLSGYLTMEDGKGQLQGFKALLRGCAIAPSARTAIQNSGRAPPPDICGKVMSTDFASSPFGKAHEGFFSSLRKGVCSGNEG